MHTIKLKHPQDETNQQGWITNYLDNKMDMKDLLFLQSLCLVSSMSTAFLIPLRMSILTIAMTNDMIFGWLRRCRLASLVHSSHAELICHSFFQTGNLKFACICFSWHQFDPIRLILIQHFDNVMLNRTTTIRLGWLPFQRNRFIVIVNDFRFAGCIGFV